MGEPNNLDNGQNETKPVWSPYGLKIAFHVTNINIGLDTYRQVAPNGDEATGPIDYTGWKNAVSPDRTKEAHVQDHDLWSMNTDGTENQQVLSKNTFNSLVSGCLCKIEYVDWSGVEITDY